MDQARTTLKVLQAKRTELTREQKSIPLTLENVERKQAIQDAINQLDIEFAAISRTIKSH